MKGSLNTLFAVLLLTSAYSQDGTLDNTFDSDGMVLTAVGTFDDVAMDIKVQNDGKIVVAGRSYGNSDYDFLLLRYNSNGSLDNSFGINGVVRTAIGSSDDKGTTMIIQADGKILVAGTSFNGVSDIVALARYNSDGTLDTSFDGDGIVTTNTGATGDYIEAIALDANGKIVVVGGTLVTSYMNVLLLRYNSNGSLDNSFDGDGILISNLAPNGSDLANDVAIQSDGKIVIAGHANIGTNTDFAVARYNSDGTLDNSFSGDGTNIHGIEGMVNEYGNALRIQADGKIVVVGNTENDFFDVVITRYNSDGTLDNSFDTDGIVVTDYGTSTDDGAPTDVILQADGKLLVSGYRLIGIRNIFALQRYNTNGSLDASFDSDGMVTTDFGGAYDCQGTSIALQSDGKILVAGGSYDVQSEVAIARYNNSVSATEGLQELSSIGMKVAPNPFSDQTVLTFSQSLSNAQILVLSLKGEVVHEMKNCNGNSILLDRNGLPSGIYFVEIRDGNSWSKQKLVVR